MLKVIMDVLFRKALSWSFDGFKSLSRLNYILIIKVCVVHDQVNLFFIILLAATPLASRTSIFEWVGKEIEKYYKT